MRRLEIYIEKIEVDDIKTHDLGWLVICKELDNYDPMIEVISQAWGYRWHKVRFSHCFHDFKSAKEYIDSFLDNLKE